jgi:hypothetical protein
MLLAVEKSGMVWVTDQCTDTLKAKNANEVLAVGGENRSVT